MADVQPFRARRFRDPNTGNAAPCAAPPYDVIHGAERDRYAASSPANVVHLTLPTARDGLDPYASAGARLVEFCADSRLVRDDEPTIYLQDVEFRSPGDSAGTLRSRKGFIALARIEPIGKGSILGHEEVLPKAIEDRWRPMTATRTNLEPVFFLYSDPSGAIDALLEPVRTSAPPVTAAFDDMRFAFRSAPAAVAREVTRRLANEPLYIADGHHRFTVSNRVHDEHPDWKGAQFRLALFVRAEDPGLVILPTHRFVDRVDAATERVLLERQNALFEATPVEPANLIAALARHPGSLSVWWRRRDTALVLRPTRAALDRLAAIPEPLKSLDVNVLHRAWWLGEKPGTALVTPRFVRGEEDPLGLAVREDVDLAVFLQAPPVDTVIDVSNQRCFMPPKSTYFFPKAASGQVLYRFEDAPTP